MQKFTLLLLFCGLFAFSTNLSAQAGGGCTPDMSFTDFGIFPGPDTCATIGQDPFCDETLGISELGCSGQPFSFDFTAVIPDSLDAEPFIGVPLTVPLVSVEVLSVDGLDDLGWTLAGNVFCSEPNCLFTVMGPTPEGLTYGCATVSGTLPTVTQQTDYNLVFTIEGVATLFGNPVPVTLTYPDGTTFPGEYILRVLPDTDPACVTSIEDPIENDLRVAQNSPNPFSTQTTISLNSVKADTYDFRVYDLVGNLIHTSVVEAAAGENNIVFDGSALSEGVYLYAFSNENGTITRRMVVNK